MRRVIDQPQLGLIDRDLRTGSAGFDVNGRVKLLGERVDDRRAQPALASVVFPDARADR